MTDLSQKEIAEKLGISQTTVSFVMRDPNTSRVAERTRKLILDFINQKQSGPKILVYVEPDSLAQTRRILSHSDHYGLMLKGAEQLARQEGYELFFKSYQNEEELVEIAQRSHGQGMIVVNQISSNSVRNIQKHIPVVCMNGIIAESVCDQVMIDNRLILQYNIQHLFDKGHSRIAFIDFSATPGKTKPYGAYSGRLGGYCSGMFACNLPINPEYIVVIEDFIQLGYVDHQINDLMQRTLERLMSLDEPPTAIAAFNDELIVALMNTAIKSEMKLPEEMSFIGVGNTTLSERITPQLTTVIQPSRQMGAESVEQLIRQIEGSTNSQYRRIMCPTSIIERDSVADISKKSENQCKGAFAG